MMIGGFLLLILFVGFVVYLLAGPDALRRFNLGGHRSGHMTDDDTALSILKERYARGEITTEEYQDMRRALREDESMHS
jgi:uncharacterized membrane protein